MAIFRTKSIISCVAVVALMIMFCFVVGEASSSSSGGVNGKSAASKLLEYFHHRKFVLLEKQEKASFLVHGHGAATTSGSAGNRGTMGDWELRRVPAGPDPLHHNGATPKKPRTTP